MKKYLSYIILTTLLLCFSSLSLAIQAETSIVVLSGDIGGTNARLRLTQLKNNQKHILVKATYKVAEYGGDTLKIIKLFLEKYQDSNIHINSMCLAVNGPIENDKSLHYDPEQLKRELNIDNVILINDLEAVGYGLESLTEKDLYTLQAGSPKKNGLKAYVAAGTGFGMGFATFDSDKYVVHRSEVGGNTFIPSNIAQYKIYSYLTEKHGNVLTAKALVRGRGIVDIYGYYSARKANNEPNTAEYSEDTQLKALLEDPAKDHPKEIANFALDHSDDQNQIAVKTLRTFVKIYSEKSRDVSYTLLPYGGLYIVGNIAANILTKPPFDKLFSETFSQDNLLKDLPVYVVLDTEIGVQGAENCAFKGAKLGLVK